MTIPTARVLRAGAQTFLFHLLGGGHADARYAIQHFRFHADGEIAFINPGTERIFSLMSPMGMLSPFESTPSQPESVSAAARMVMVAGNRNDHEMPPG